MIALALLALPSGFGEAAETSVRLVAEAEDFKVERGWRVVPWRENYFASTFAVTFLSRKACLGAGPGDEGLATLEVTVPRAGDYEVFARYEQPWLFSVEFDVEVRQEGRLSRHTFGRPGDLRLWPFQGGREAAIIRFPWGSTDNIVWQRGGRVRLQAGRTELVLRARAQGSGGAETRAAARHVDVILLTDDRAGIESQRKSRYLPLDGWLVQDGDVFVRFTNPVDGLGPVVPVVEGYARGQHSPYHVHIRDWPRTLVTRTGAALEGLVALYAGPRSTAVDQRHLSPAWAAPTGWQPKLEDALQPGDRSGWVPMGGVLDSLNDSQWLPRAIYPGHSVGELDLELELAVPDGSRGLRPFRKLRLRGRPEYLSPVTVVFPGNVRSETRASTQLEAVESVVRAVEAFPPRGSVPRRFPVHGLLGFSAVLDDPGALGTAARRLARLLGAPEPSGRWRIATHWPIAQVEARLAEARKSGQADQLAIVSYGDEQRVLPEQLPLYTEKTRLLEAALPGVRTGMNYAPHPNYLVDATHFIEPFRSGALTQPWSEDYVWQVPEFSVQVTGYLVSGFRAGARARDLPILMYVMPHSPGNTPRSFRLSFYAAVAHGARMLHLYCATPQSVGTTENYVADDDLGMWRAIRDAVHDVGVFEGYVLDGRVRPARVGLLLSPEDERQTGDTSKQGGIHNQERKAVYYALRDAHVPVDFVAEDDFSEGRVGTFDLVYVTQQYLHSKTIAALTRFAEMGGTVVALAGGGFLDENGQGNPGSGRLYGIADQSLFKDPALPMVLAKQDLPGLEPLDHARLGDLDIPALVWKQAILPSDGRVLGRFRDGTAAIVEKRHGKGRAILFGFFPGMAYLQSGLPLRPVDRAATDAGFNHFLPTAMDARIRRAIVDDFLPPNLVRPVETSEPLVEATVIETKTPRRLAVPLMNYTGKPLQSVKVTLRGLGRWSRVRSVERGELSIVADGGVTTIALPLDVADMLLFDAERVDAER